MGLRISQEENEVKSFAFIVLMVLAWFFATPAHGQYTRPVYVSMPSAGNLQHLPLAAAKFKGFYNEMGIDRKSTRLNSSHIQKSRMPSSA